MPDGKYFFILSKQNGRVLEVSAGPESSGRVWLKETFNDGSGQEAAHQQWYKDSGVGTIRCRLHGLCLDINGESQ